MNNSWMEEFNLEDNSSNTYTNTDYDIFENKEELDKLRIKIIQELIDSHEIEEENIEEVIDRIAVEYDLLNEQRDYLKNLINNELNGFGPITELLKDKNVTEIMINSPDEIYIEVDGIISRDYDVSFINDEHIIRTVSRIIQPLGRTIDSSNPMVDSRLPDGSRINAIIPPLSVKGPVVTIRKFRDDVEDMDSLIGNGTLTPYMATFLDACIKARLNILICGGTGSGKTTLLNVLSGSIPNDERIITIEDAVELRLKQEHVISLETKTENYEKEGEITIRDLVRNSLRMRPDRIIVGEVRGKEAFDMLQAMNTGHDGSLTTLHANGVKDALNRLETMILMSEVELPIKAIRGYIDSAIDIVISVERLSDGKRKVTNISEITGFDGENIIIEDIFAFLKHGITENKEVNGEFILYENVPKIYEKIKNKGIVLDMFESKAKNKITKKTTTKKK
ncbi:MAG: CpaF family protein [Bacilli bacterium]|nr:CpaF family protein [Bacilli bacterium]